MTYQHATGPVRATMRPPCVAPASALAVGEGCRARRLGRGGGTSMSISGPANSASVCCVSKHSSDPSMLCTVCTSGPSNSPGASPSALSLPFSFSTLQKNFCAWLRICTAVFVPTCASILRQPRPYRRSASTKRACSASVHFSRGLVRVYDLRACGWEQQAAGTTCQVPR